MACRRFIALALEFLVPLVVIVENKRDEIVEPVDKTIGAGGIDELVKAAVETGEVLVAVGNVGKQADMLLAHVLQMLPQG